MHKTFQHYSFQQSILPPLPLILITVNSATMNKGVQMSLQLIFKGFLFSVHGLFLGFVYTQHHLEIVFFDFFNLVYIFFTNSIHICSKRQDFIFPYRWVVYYVHITNIPLCMYQNSSINLFLGCFKIWNITNCTAKMNIVVHMSLLIYVFCVF